MITFALNQVDNNDVIQLCLPHELQVQLQELPTIYEQYFRGNKNCRYAVVA